MKDFVEYKLSAYKVANPTKRSDLLPKSIYAFDIPNEIAIPLMLKLGWTRDKLHEKAKRYLNIVCLFEAMFDYNIIRFQGYIYDAMLQKNGTYLNPNFIQMNLVALKDEKGIM